MKKILIVFLLLLPFAYAEEYFDYQNLDLSLEISNSMQIIPETPNYFTDYVQAELLYFPKDDYRQTVTKLTTNPSVEIDESILFFWDTPKNEIEFIVNSELETTADLKQVNEKIGFPLRNVPSSLVEYTQTGEIIDSNSEIEQLASALAEGKDDMYEVVFELASWTQRNIEYNLSTSNVKASKPSSWVLENRQGVCDEITSLFISLCRSLGIPARFASGIAFTNADYFDDQWGPHGWAEVYFPEYGWVPFDVTYGQLGYVDAGHIKLRDAQDAKEASVLYEYVGRNIDLQTYSLEFDTRVLNTGSKVNEMVNVDIDVYEDIVGFGSYNLITATVRNRYSYYVAEELTIAKTTGITLLDSYKKTILLKPGEEKKIYWIIKVDEDLDHRSIYTFPIHIYTIRGKKTESSFKSQYGQSMVTYDELESLVSLDESSKFVDDILLLCEPVEYEIYYYEKATVNCVLKNQGSSVIEDLVVCLDESCDTYNMKGIKEISFSFQKNFEDLGLKTLPVVAKTDLFQKTNYVAINVVDEPAVYLDDINTPRIVNFNDDFSIDFSLKRKSPSYPRNVKVHLDHPVIRYDWEYDILRNNQRFRLNTEGKMLGIGENTFTLDIEFEDEDGNKYNQSEQFFINLEDTTLWQKGFVIANKIGVDIERILTNKEDSDRFFKSTKTWIITGIIISGLVLMKIVLLIERKKGTYMPGPGTPKH